MVEYRFSGPGWTYEATPGFALALGEAQGRGRIDTLEAQVAHHREVKITLARKAGTIFGVAKGILEGAKEYSRGNHEIVLDRGDLDWYVSLQRAKPGDPRSVLGVEFGTEEGWGDTDTRAVAPLRSAALAVGGVI